MKPERLNPTIQQEIRWQEQQAGRRQWWNQLLYQPPAFTPVVESLLSFLSPAPGEMVIDLGCGEGKDLPVIAQYRVKVIGVDVSPSQLHYAKQRVIAANVATSVLLVQADAQALPFPSGIFGAVFGKAVLHHLGEPHKAMAEAMRVVQPGRRIAFAEPMAGHPLFRLARRLTPHLRHAYERPFTVEDFRRLSLFGGSGIKAWFLLTPLAYVLRLLPAGEGLFRRVHAGLWKLDARLFQRFPFSRRWAWYGTLELEKPL